MRIVLKWKRLISALIVAIMVTSVLPTSAFAGQKNDSDIKVGDIAYADIAWSRTKEGTLFKGNVITLTRDNWMWSSVANLDHSMTDIEKVWDAGYKPYYSHASMGGAITVAHNAATWTHYGSDGGTPSARRFHGVFKVPAGYTLADEAMLLTVGDYSSLGLGNILPINDYLYVFIYPADITLTDSNFTNYLAFWTGTNAASFHGVDKTASTHFKNKKSISGVPAIIRHTDGWYADATADNLGAKMLAMNPNAKADTEWIIDIIATDNYEGGGMDEMAIAFKKLENPNSLIINYYQDSISDETFLGSYVKKDVEPGSKVKLELGTGDGQLNMFKSKTKDPWAYLNGVQTGEGDFIIQPGENRIDVLYTRTRYDVTVHYRGYDPEKENSDHILDFDHTTGGSVKGLAPVGPLDSDSSITIVKGGKTQLLPLHHQFEGYVLDAERSTSITVDASKINQEITLWYALQHHDIDYWVEYYVDDQLQADDTAAATAHVPTTVGALAFDGSLIDAEKYKDRGYRLTRTEPAEIPAQVADGTVVKVYYEKDDSLRHALSYTVEYYRDNRLVEADTDTVTAEVWLGETELDVNKGALNTTDKYPGYSFEKVEPGEIPDRIANEGVIRVYYTKNIYDLKVEHRYGDAPGDRVTASGRVAYGDDVTAAPVFEHEGVPYVLVEREENPAIETDGVESDLAADSDGNVAGTMPAGDATITYTYEIAPFPVTVRYYYAAAVDANLLGSVQLAEQPFGTALADLHPLVEADYAKTGIETAMPTGYATITDDIASTEGATVTRDAERNVIHVVYPLSGYELAVYHHYGDLEPIKDEGEDGQSSLNVLYGTPVHVAARPAHNEIPYALDETRTAVTAPEGHGLTGADTVSGSMPAGSVEIHYYYTLAQYPVTVEYYYGDPAAEVSALTALGELRLGGDETRFDYGASIPALAAEHAIPAYDDTGLTAVLPAGYERAVTASTLLYPGAQTVSGDETANLVRIIYPARVFNVNVEHVFYSDSSPDGVVVLGGETQLPYGGPVASAANPSLGGENFEYTEVTASTGEGWRIDDEGNLSGTMPAGDLTITYTYRLRQYPVTVEYYYGTVDEGSRLGSLSLGGEGKLYDYGTALQSLDGAVVRDFADTGLTGLPAGYADSVEKTDLLYPAAETVTGDAAENLIQVVYPASDYLYLVEHVFRDSDGPVGDPFRTANENVTFGGNIAAAPDNTLPGDGRPYVLAGDPVFSDSTARPLGDDKSFAGTMPAGDLTVTYTYELAQHPVRLEYYLGEVGADTLLGGATLDTPFDYGTPLATIRSTVAGSYNTYDAYAAVADSPAAMPAGFDRVTDDVRCEAGAVVTDDLDANVIRIVFPANTYKLRVEHVYINGAGETAGTVYQPEDAPAQVTFGAAITASPNAGLLADGNPYILTGAPVFSDQTARPVDADFRFAGTMPAGDLTIAYTYQLQQYGAVVEYYYGSVSDDTLLGTLPLDGLYDYGTPLSTLTDRVGTAYDASADALAALPVGFDGAEGAIQSLDGWIITSVAENNIIRVVFPRLAYNLTVRHDYDGDIVTDTAQSRTDVFYQDDIGAVEAKPTHNGAPYLLVEGDNPAIRVEGAESGSLSVSGSAVSGSMPAGNVVITYTYRAAEYPVVVRYYTGEVSRDNLLGQRKLDGTYLYGTPLSAIRGDVDTGYDDDLSDLPDEYETEGKIDKDPSLAWVTDGDNVISVVFPAQRQKYLVVFRAIGPGSVNNQKVVGAADVLTVFDAFPRFPTARPDENAEVHPAYPGWYLGEAAAAAAPTGDAIEQVNGRISNQHIQDLFGEERVLYIDAYFQYLPAENGDIPVVHEYYLEETTTEPEESAEPATERKLEIADDGQIINPIEYGGNPVNTDRDDLRRPNPAGSEYSYNYFETQITRTPKEEATEATEPTEATTEAPTEETSESRDIEVALALSIHDQLRALADENGISYEQAAWLLRQYIQGGNSFATLIADTQAELTKVEEDIAQLETMLAEREDPTEAASTEEVPSEEGLTEEGSTEEPSSAEGSTEASATEEGSTEAASGESPSQEGPTEESASDGSDDLEKVTEEQIEGFAAALGDLDLNELPTDPPEPRQVETSDGPTEIDDDKTPQDSALEAILAMDEPTKADVEWALGESRRRQAELQELLDQLTAVDEAFRLTTLPAQVGQLEAMSAIDWTDPAAISALQEEASTDSEPTDGSDPSDASEPTAEPTEPTEATTPPVDFQWEDNVLVGAVFDYEPRLFDYEVTIRYSRIEKPTENPLEKEDETEEEDKDDVIIIETPTGPDETTPTERDEDTTTTRPDGQQDGGIPDGGQPTGETDAQVVAPIVTAPPEETQSIVRNEDRTAAGDPGADRDTTPLRADTGPVTPPNNLIDIDEVTVPLAAGSNTMKIVNEDVPLSKLPNTGGSGKLIGGLGALLLGMAGLLGAFLKKKD